MKFVAEKELQLRKRADCLCSYLVRTKKSALFAIILCSYVGKSICQQFNEVSSPASNCLFVCLSVSQFRFVLFGLSKLGQHLSRMAERVTTMPDVPHVGTRRHHDIKTYRRRTERHTVFRKTASFLIPTSVF